MNEQDMKVFGGSEGFHVLFLFPGNRKELSAADSAGVGSTFCFCMKLFRNLEIMVANFQQIVYNKFTNKRFLYKIYKIQGGVHYGSDHRRTEGKRKN